MTFRSRSRRGSSSTVPPVTEELKAVASPVPVQETPASSSATVGETEIPESESAQVQSSQFAKFSILPPPAPGSPPPVQPNGHIWVKPVAPQLPGIGVPLQRQENPAERVMARLARENGAQARRIGSERASVSVQRVEQYRKLGASTREEHIEDLASIKYSEEAQAFEKRLGRYAANHPRALRIAKVLAEKALELVEKHGADKGIRLSDLGSSSPAATGAVGQNERDLRDVVQNGNFRELMTFVYGAFQKGAPLVGKDPRGPNSLFPPNEQVSRDRPERSLWQKTEPVWDVRTQIAPSDVSQTGPELSERERNFAVDQGRLQWNPGMRLFHYKLSGEYQREAHEQQVMVGAGRSGTTWGMFHTAKALGLDSLEDLQDFRLACLGWMIPAQDHTFYEIMFSAEQFDPRLAFIPGPRGYRHVAPLSEEELRTLTSDGRFPDEYLGASYKQWLSEDDSRHASATAVQTRRVQSADLSLGQEGIEVQRTGDLAGRINARRGRGEPLELRARGALEAGLGADLSGVRVHTDGEADQLARSVQAVAFTTGSDIFFRHDMYRPGTQQGMQLLAHEATHTIQQKRGPVAGTLHPGGVSISDPSDRFEREAEIVAQRVMVQQARDGSTGDISAERRAATPAKNRSTLSIQRQIAIQVNELEALRGFIAGLKNSTYTQVISLFSNYHKAAGDAEIIARSRLVREKIDEWLVGHPLPRNGDDTAKATLLGQVRTELLEEQKELELYVQVGLHRTFYAGLSNAAKTALKDAHWALANGNVGAADVQLAALRAEIPDMYEALKGVLLRHHIGTINPRLRDAIDGPNFRNEWDVVAVGNAQARANEFATAGRPSPHQLTYAQWVANADQRLVDDNARLAKIAGGPSPFTTMSQAERGMVYGYTTDDYRHFNKPLREELEKFDQKKTALTTVAISGMNKLPPFVGTTYRLAGLTVGYSALAKPGATLSDMGFVSTAESMKGADAGASKSEVLEIIEGRTGRLISRLSHFAGEGEVLFKPGTRFRVIGRHDKNQKDGTWHPVIGPVTQGLLAQVTPRADRAFKTPSLVVFKKEM